MLTVEVMAQPALDPAASHVADIELIERAPERPERAALRAYALTGAVVSLGRYHLSPSGDESGQVALHRRLGGGRVLPLGAGFVVLALTLPHRSALVGAEPLALRPEQVLNRCVRGVIGGLRTLGVEAFYPGRDAVTVARRLLGTVSLEVDAGGGTVFETVLAIDGDWLSLPRLLAAADAGGVLAAEERVATQVTTLAEHGARPTVEQLADSVAASFAAQFGVTLVAGEIHAAPDNASERADAWIRGRRRRPELAHHAVTWVQLGVVEAYLAVGDGAITEAQLAGDFIADSASLRRFEHRLRGCRLERAAVTAAVHETYATPGSFLLGVGPLDTIVDTILRAA